MESNHTDFLIYLFTMPYDHWSTKLAVTSGEIKQHSYSFSITPRQGHIKQNKVFVHAIILNKRNGSFLLFIKMDI